MSSIMGRRYAPGERIYNTFDLTSYDIAQRVKECDVIMIPMGSCEKHGPHIPTGVDTNTTWTIVTRAAAKADVMHTQIIPVGYSPHHMGPVGTGSGTLTFDGPTYRRIIYSLGRCMIYHGFNKIVFVSIHGSNTQVMEEVLRRLRYDTGAFIAWYKPACERMLTPISDILEGAREETPGWHSGEQETSHALAFNETTCHMERAKPDSAHAPAWMGPGFHKLDGTRTVEFQGLDNIWVPMEHHEYCDTATIGNPLRASKEKGEALYESQSDHLAAFLREVKKIDMVVPSDKRDFPSRASGLF